MEEEDSVLTHIFVSIAVIVIDSLALAYVFKEYGQVYFGRLTFLNKRLRQSKSGEIKV